MQAQLLVVFATMCWGLQGLCSRPLTAGGFSSIEIVACKSIVTAVCLVSFLFLTDREKLKIPLKDLRIFILMGGLGLAVNGTFYFMTMELITLSAASILLYTSPFIVMLLSALVFKERITPHKIIALLIAFAGCVMTVGITGGENISVAGILTGMASAFFYSLYTILGKSALQKYSAFTVTAYAFSAASVFLLPFCNFGKTTVLFAQNNVNLVNLLILAVLMTLLPFVCYTKGLENLEPSRASTLAFTEPLAASIAGIIVYNEMLSASKLLGAALIFLSLILLNLKGRKPQT